MTRKIRAADLPDFDFSEHLDNEQAIAEYLTVILEENDPALWQRHERDSQTGQRRIHLRTTFPPYRQRRLLNVMDVVRTGSNLR